jgi:hypothetical protein
MVYMTKKQKSNKIYKIHQNKSPTHSLAILTIHLDLIVFAFALPDGGDNVWHVNDILARPVTEAQVGSDRFGRQSISRVRESEASSREQPFNSCGGR